MVSVSEKVAEGYRSLAERTLAACDCLTSGRYNSADYKLELPVMAQFADSLEKLKSSGDIDSIGRESQNAISRARTYADRCIPRNLVPHDTVEAFGIASVALRGYLHIGSVEELFKKAGIDSVVRGDFSGVLTTADRSGKCKKIFLVEYDPRHPVISSIGNIVGLYPTIQNESSEIEGILKGLTQIEGYSKLMDEIHGNDHLQKLRVDTAMETNDLAFFSKPEILKIAKDKGVNMEAFESYLEENRPKLNLLDCFVMGEANVLCPDMILTVPDLQKYPAVLEGYQFVALTDALLGPFMEPKKQVRRIGIGISEYVQRNPGEKDPLKKSKEFQQALTQKYFS